MNDKLNQLAEILIMVETGEMQPVAFLLAFKARFPKRVTNARNRWKRHHQGSEKLDWSKLESSPLLSQLIKKDYSAGRSDGLGYAHLHSTNN